MNLALCKCGIDMTEHDRVNEHRFDAAGTKHRCEKFVTANWGRDTFLCPRPAYHEEEGIACGPLTNEKLWY